MSGLRVYDPELSRVGMTLPGFAERTRAIVSMPSLSLLTLAALTPERFEIEYHEVADVERMGTLPSCDLAAISTLTAAAKEAYRLAERYRVQGVTTVMGGLHVTACPEEALQHCDAVVVGEGEVSWPTLLDDFTAGRLQRVYAANGREFDLALAPVPRYDLLDPDKYNRLPVQTQRGCPWKCDFCASSIRLTPRYKLKPVARVLDEIRAVKAIWPNPFVEFADDNTFANKVHGKELMRALAGEGIRWFTETDISVADDAELLSLMRDAGCAQVLIGLESPTAAGLDGVELRRNWKRQQLEHYKASIEQIQSHGIAVNGCFILGLDGDTAEVFDAVETFARDSGLYDVQITVLTPFPGTPLYARLQQEGRLLDERAWEKCTLFDVNYQPKHMSVAALEQGFIALGTRLYSGEARQARTGAYRRRLRQSSTRRRRKQ